MSMTNTINIVVMDNLHYFKLLETRQQKTYDKTFIKADGQVIGLNFTDGICFEIVPCFVNQNDSFTFPIQIMAVAGNLQILNQK